MKPFYYLLFALFFQISSIYAQESKVKRINNFIDYIEKNNRAIGNVSIFKDGKEIYHRKFGTDKLNSNNENVAYQIASVTKLVTATLIYQLIEKEQLSLQDALDQFYPEIPNASKISIMHLLNHTSGLGDVNFKDKDSKWLHKKIYNSDEIIKNIKESNILFEPGTQYSYSNSGYYLLGKILEKKYELPFYKIVTNQISTPLKLKQFDAYSPNQTNIIQSLTYKDKNWEYLAEPFPANSTAYGDMSATSNDLNIFITALFNEQLISKESIELMKPNKDKYLGSAMETWMFYDIELYGHSGDLLGSHTFLGFNEADKLAIAININGNRNTKNNFYVSILNAIYDGKLPYPLYLSDDILNNYVGKYYCKDYPFELKIFNKNGDLYAEGQADGQIPFYLNPIEEYLFENLHLKIQFDTKNNKLMFTERDKIYEFIKKQ